MGTYQHLLVEKQDRIAVLTINRAEKFNTFGPDVWLEMRAAAQEIEAMDDLGAVVICAKGDHFSAGIDLKDLNTFNSEIVFKTVAWSQAVYTTWEEFPVPVVAAIQGLCYGSAMELILSCDIRVAASNARFSIPEVRFGLAPDMGGTTRMTKLVGSGQAKRMIMCCDEIDAAEAKAIGLVEITAEPDALLATAMKYAKKMASLPPVAIKMAKKGINLAAESSVRAGLLFEQAQTTYCCGTEDQKEAIAAFFEKRKPVFKGR
jgi:enoyl-CoA hydratase